MTFSNSFDQRLNGAVRAEFDRALSHQSNLWKIQVLLAGAAIASVFWPSTSNAAALIGLLLLAVYAWQKTIYEEVKARANQGRRAVLVSSSLGGLTPDQRRDLLSRFSSTSEEGEAREDPAYYASSATEQNKRLAEMLEESAFWTADLHGQAARRSWSILIIFLAIALTSLLLLPFISAGPALNIARTISAMLVLLMSGEMLGTALSFSSAQKCSEKVVERLQRIKAEGSPISSLIIVFADYNAAVEAAPIVPGRLYEKRKPELNRLWSEHSDGSKQQS
ncbi:hypothetical protein [Lacisediminimonas profundi]|uniref:hypothetical protein n=1 Tax=Lacisediminimonas profundi TaxID=2603856 RepID=UPI00124BAF38|nr:hypothetical protein [Lacisediminimonas profundi]